MKIGIYTDAHFSQSSSILVGSHGTKYSTRLSSLIDSFKWMYEVFNSKDVSVIFNLGDLLSSHNIDAETNTALEEALSYSFGIQEYWLIGNHEMKSYDSQFNSLSLLKRNPNINIISGCKEFELENKGDGDTINVLACSFSNNEKLIEKNCADLKNPTIVFTHQMYTKVIPQITSGVDMDLIQALPNIKRIFNGHIHSAFDYGKYCQVGSITGGSFGDSYKNSLPCILIYDTDADSIERIENPYSTLYYTLQISSVDQVEDFIKDLPIENPKLLRFRIPLCIKDDFKNYVDNENQKWLENYNIIAYRIITDSSGYNGDSDIKNSSISFRSKSVIDSLRSFIQEPDTNTPYEVKDMLGFIDKYLV